MEKFFFIWDIKTWKWKQTKSNQKDHKKDHKKNQEFQQFTLGHFILYPQRRKEFTNQLWNPANLISLRRVRRPNAELLKSNFYYILFYGKMVNIGKNHFRSFKNILNDYSRHFGIHLKQSWNESFFSSSFLFSLLIVRDCSLHRTGCGSICNQVQMFKREVA